MQNQMWRVCEACAHKITNTIKKTKTQVSTNEIQLYPTDSSSPPPSNRFAVPLLDTTDILDWKRDLNDMVDRVQVNPELTSSSTTSHFVEFVGFK
jgi:hypothetical protein